MALLTGVYVVLAFFEDTSQLEWDWLTVTLLGLCGVFMAEFAVRFLDSEHPLLYVEQHWLDLVTAIPFVGPLRAVRILRLLRFLRLSMHVRHAISARRGHRRSGDDNTWILWPFLVLFWTGAAYALWIFEAGYSPSITSYSSALLAALLTASTLGYGATPVTIGGKVVSGLIVFVSIGLVGFASSRITAYWLGQKESHVPEQISLVRRELFDIKKAIERIEREMVGTPELKIEPIGGDGRVEETPLPTAAE